MKRFFDRLKESSGNFTRSQHVIAEFMQEHMESAAFCTVEMLSNKIDVSTTTIIRFARALGYEGFTDMQRAIQSELQNKRTLPERLDHVHQNTGDVLLTDCFKQDLQNIEMTLAAQNDTDLENALSLISDANKVYVLGLRSSFSLSYYMASRLGEIKKNVHCIQSTGMLYPEEIINAEPGDVCIAYLFPRYSKTAINIVNWLKKRGVKILLFTSLGNDMAVSSYADVTLPCILSSLSYKSSLVAPICLTNYIVAALASRNYTEARQMLAYTEDVLSTGYYVGL